MRLWTAANRQLETHRQKEIRLANQVARLFGRILYNVVHFQANDLMYLLYCCL